MSPESAPTDESQDVKLELAQQLFLSTTPGVRPEVRESLKQQMLQKVTEGDRSPLYQHLCERLGLQVDAALLTKMQTANSARLKELDEKITDAEANLGETEVRDALHAKAEYLCSIGDKDAAIAAYKETDKKSAGAGIKVDLIFSQIRLNILYADWTEVKNNIAAAKKLCQQGGDWERKNKLKVYEGLLAMYSRNFKRAADLFLDSTATFTTYELFTYPRCIFYAVITSLISLDRVSLKKRVVDAPEILTVIDQIPPLGTLVSSLYYCKYKEFFQAFVAVVDQIREDMYLHPHVSYFQRELRAVAYSQFLESYKSVTLESMAAAFDVSISFLDEQMAEFIVAGRVNAKIDKVAGIIETNRPDRKNALYQETIKKGDALLNKVQKLANVTEVE